MSSQSLVRSVPALLRILIALLCGIQIHLLLLHLSDFRPCTVPPASAANVVVAVDLKTKCAVSFTDTQCVCRSLTTTAVEMGVTRVGTYDRRGHNLQKKMSRDQDVKKFERLSLVCQAGYESRAILFGRQ
jgi:hypothetical protein